MKKNEDTAALAKRFAMVADYLRVALYSNGLKMRVRGVKRALVTNVNCDAPLSAYLKQNDIDEIGSETFDASAFSTFLQRKV